MMDGSERQLGVLIDLGLAGAESHQFLFEGGELEPRCARLREHVTCRGPRRALRFFKGGGARFFELGDQIGDVALDAPKALQASIRSVELLRELEDPAFDPIQGRAVRAPGWLRRRGNLAQCFDLLGDVLELVLEPREVLAADFGYTIARPRRSLVEGTF